METKPNETIKIKKPLLQGILGKIDFKAMQRIQEEQHLLSPDEKKAWDGLIKEVKAAAVEKDIKIKKLKEDKKLKVSEIKSKFDENIKNATDEFEEIVENIESELQSIIVDALDNRS